MAAAVRFHKSLQLSEGELSTVDSPNDDREKCQFMLQQLGSIDRRLQSLVEELDNTYLTIEQAKQLKHFRACSERAAQEFNSYVLYQAQQEREDVLKDKIAITLRKVQRLRAETASRESINHPELARQLQQLEQQYIFENKMTISLQKQHNRSLQQDELIRLKIQQLEKREVHLLTLADRSAERVRETANQKALQKKYEALMAKRTSLCNSKQQAEEASKERVKREVDKLAKVQQHIVEEDYYFAQMEKAVIQQRLVIEQLKQEEGLPEDGMAKDPEEKYHVELNALKLKNQLYEKYLGGRRHSSIVELPRYPVKQLQQRRFSRDQDQDFKREIKEIERVPVKPQIEYEFVKSDGKQLKLPEPFQYRDTSTSRKLTNKKAINISAQQLPDIKKKVQSLDVVEQADLRRTKESTQREIRRTKQSKTQPAVVPKKPKKQVSDDSDNSASSNENLFQPVRITKEVVVEGPGKQLIIEDEGSEESDQERLFNKPLKPRIVKLEKPPKRIEEKPEEEEPSSESEIQPTVKNKPIFRTPPPVQYTKPNINLLMEKNLYLSSQNEQSESEVVESVKELPSPPRVVNSPRQPVKIPDKKLDSTATDMNASIAPPTKKMRKPRGNNQRKGIPFEAEGHSQASPSDAEFNLSRVSSLFTPPSLTGSHLGYIPHYTAEQLGLQQASQQV